MNSTSSSNSKVRTSKHFHKLIVLRYNSKTLITRLDCRYLFQFYAKVTTRHVEAQEYEEIMVELSRTPGKGLGLSVVGRRDGCGVFISDMVSLISFRKKSFYITKI